MRLIDADELMIILQDHCGANCMYTEQERQKTDICDSCLLGDAKDYIDRMPTVKTKPMNHGHWIYREYGYPLAHNFYACSVCGSSRGLNIDNYCPHCGAKMDNVLLTDTQEVKHGHWIKRTKVNLDLLNESTYNYECSNCGHWDTHGANVEVPYCWHCGAKMDEISNDNETSSSVYESIKQGLEDAINGDVRKSEISNG